MGERGVKPVEFFPSGQSESPVGAGRPPASGALAAYLTAHAETLKVFTLGRRLTAIRTVHLYAGKTLDLTGQAFRDAWGHPA